MADSLTEIVVERFYRSKGYLVERDVPIIAAKDGPQFWSDLDILAVKDAVLLVNCKDFVGDPKQKDRIRDNLRAAEEHVKTHYAQVAAGKQIVRQMVYMGSDRKTLEQLQADGIKCISLDDLLADYLDHLGCFLDSLNRGEPNHKYQPPKGARWYRVGNLRGYDKLLVYLLNRKFIATREGKMRKWE